MKPFRWLALLVVPILIAACGPTPQEQADLAAVQRSGVPSATYDKMEHGDALSLADIESLRHAGVSDAVVLRYIRDQGTIYTLNSDDVLRLRKAGVSQSVIDYMLETARAASNYPGYYDYPWYGPGWGPWGPWYGPGFYGPGIGFGFYGGSRWHGGGHGGHHH